MTISTQKPSAAIVLAPLLLVLQATLSVEKVALLLYAVFVAVCYAAAIGFLWAWRSISGIIIALATGLHKTSKTQGENANKFESVPPLTLEPPFDDPQKFELANEGVTAAPLFPELGEHSTTSGTPNREKGLTIGPETPRMFFKAWRRQGPASIDASSSVSSMKSPPALIRNVNESPNVIPDGKRKFRYRTYGFELGEVQSFPLDTFAED